MSIEKFPYWIELTLMNAADQVPLNNRQFIGERNEADSLPEEWISSLLLGMVPERVRPKDYVGNGVFQVSCFAKFAHHRNDGDARRPWTMAGIVSTALSNKSLEIRDYDADEPSRQGCLTLGRGEMQYVPERNINQTLSSEIEIASIHAVVISFPVNANGTG